MSPPAKLEINLKPPLNGDFYSGDEYITGSVRMQLSKSLPILKVTVHLKGFTETQTKISSDYMIAQNGMLTPVQDNRSYHRLLEIEKRMFPPDNVWNALEGSPKPFKVNPGEYTYDFKFEKLKGKKPNCLKNHKKNTICFLKRKDIRLPPTFNLKWKELNKIDNLDLYYYSFGKVLYIIEVNIELGKPKSWFKPFDRIIRDIQSIEYIPTVKDITYPDEEDKEREAEVNRNILHSFDLLDYGSRSTHSTMQELSSIALPATTFLDSSSTSNKISSERSPSPMINTPSPFHDVPNNNGSGSTATSPNNNRNAIGSNKYKYYKSTFKIGIPSNSEEYENSMWVEVRSKNDGFKHVFRNDPLFKRNSNKFDKVYLICKGKLSEIKKLAIKPVRLQLNLLENATYLSRGVANENISSLRLVELNMNDMNSVFNINDLKQKLNGEADSSSNNNNVDEATFIGKSECQIKLRENAQLRRLLFNEENYKHRGNKLYSFKTCTIRRTFKFQLLIDWCVEHSIKQTEIIIEPTQIFCQVRESNNNDSGVRGSVTDYLPRYVEPPVYDEFGGQGNDEEAMEENTNDKRLKSSLGTNKKADVPSVSTNSNKPT